MKIVNRTHWRTDQIRPILARVAADELEPADRKRVVVTLILVKRRRDHLWVGGEAYLGTRGSHTARHMTLKLPRLQVDPVAMAKVAAHEMAHLRGLTHAEMRSIRYSYREPGWRDYYAWAQAYPIERRPVAPRLSTEDRRAAKLAHAQAMVLKWARAQKRAATKVATWRRRARALDLRIAKAAQLATSVDSLHG